MYAIKIIEFYNLISEAECCNLERLTREHLCAPNFNFRFTYVWCELSRHAFTTADAKSRET